MQIVTQAPLTALASKFEVDLEGLRGFAAILVLWCHAVGMPYYLDQGYNPSGILGYQAPAHFMVLIFFVLSGYVIGLSTKGQITFATVGTYLKKRLLRIYPIYFVCLLLALLVASQSYSWKVIVGHLAFLQVARVDIIHELDPSWSLEFEVLYYALFIPLSFFRLNAVVVAITCLVLALLNIHFRPAAPLVSSYAFGFVFWCCGLALSRASIHWPRFTPSYRVLLSVLLLFLSFPEFSFDWLLTAVLVKLRGHDIAYALGVNGFQAMITPHDLTYLIFAVLGVLVFTHKLFPYRQLILPVLLLTCGLGFIPIYRQWNTIYQPTYLVTSAFYLAALFTYFTRFAWLESTGKYLMHWLIRAGSISYGLYIVHFPILFIFKQVHSFTGSPLSFWVRFAVFIGLSFLAAYLLEKIFQPWARGLIARR